ncbi:ankyrin repeat domain-containing protein [Pseudoalteromonas sp. A601]|nr:ankyrin repeat domain-containing protein [Pseudoalteromonas sp. A601]
MSNKSNDIEKQDNDGWTPLMLAVLRGELDNILSYFKDR